MKRLTKQMYYYIGIHVAVPMLFVLSPFILSIQFLPFQFVMGCFFYDYFHLYCPLCGGTRTVEALSRLDFKSAIALNAPVVGFILFLIVWDVFCLVRLLRKEERWWRLPKRTWLIIGFLFLVFMVVRNVLMVFFKIDTIGDLVVFWH